MEYQVVDKNGNIVAWINTNGKCICDKDYTIIQGNNLSHVVIEDKMKPIIAINCTN